MGRVLTPLQQMGLEIEGGRDRLPLIARGSANLVPIEYELPVPSAQVKSAVLLAGLHAAGETSVIEAEATRDHTERMLRHFGAEVAVAMSGGKTRITVKGEAELQGRDVAVPADPSSAAFLAAAAALVAGSDITLEGVLVNPTRIGFYEVLREMGGRRRVHERARGGGEPVADIRVRYAKLAGVHVAAHRAPSMIDEYPILAVVAAFADGETRMDGLAELKVKESDRLAATVAGLDGQRRHRARRRRYAIGAWRRPSARRRHGLNAPRPPHRHGVSHHGAGQPRAGDGRRHAHGGDELPRIRHADAGARRALFGTGRTRTMIIAIDGPAASGKGTLAKRIADHWRLPCLDTGLALSRRRPRRRRPRLSPR